MGESLVSVVLPIYRTEKYLDRCIASVVNQTYPNLEILLIDDGSPDNCPAMCEDWARRDSRIRVIHKTNAGLGMARNTGIENAAGDYICFFDSDDYVAPDTVEKTLKLAKQEKSDLVLFGLANVDAEGQPAGSVIPHTDKLTYEGEEVQRVFLPDLIGTARNSPRKNLYLSACLYLYSMDMIRKSGWRFVSEREIISEDVYALLYLYRHVQRLTVLEEALYFYCENAASLTHSYRKDRFEKLCYFHEVCVKATEELGYDREVAVRFQEPLISNLIAAMKMIMLADCPEPEKRKEIKSIVNSAYLRQIQWSSQLKTNSAKRNLFVYLLKKRCFWGCYMLLKLSAR